MDLSNWSTIPHDKLGEFEYGVKHDDDAHVAVGYTHADPGYVVWTTEGPLHEGGSEARLDYHPNEADAKEHVHDYAADHQDVKKARQAVRGTGDAAKGVADPDGMDESLPWSAFGGGREVKYRVENAFESVEELAEASDDHLRSFEGVGPTTVENLRSWLAEEGYADEDPTTPDPKADVEMEISVEPSGLTLDDPATEITGVGDSSNLADETVGDFWDMGCPFHEVAPAWQEEALHDILGAEFFDQDNPAHLVRVFAGYTAAYGYDEAGEELGNFPEGMFGQFNWADVMWAWADHGLTTDFGDAAAADEVIEKQAAVATGKELPFDVLDYDPEEDAGLSGLHGTASVEPHYPRNGGVWFEYDADIDADNSTAYVPQPTVELYSLLFGADYTDPDVAEEYVYLVVDINASDDSKQSSLERDGNNNRYVAVFDHPNADAYGIAEGRITIRPSDFDLTEPAEYEAWAEQVKEQYHQRKQDFADEMERTPSPEEAERIKEGVAPFRQLDDAAGVRLRTEEHAHPDDETHPDTEDVWDDMMGEIYDPARDLEADVEAAEEAGALEPSESTGIDRLSDPPQEVAGYELVENDPDGGMVKWEGRSGGSPPAIIDHDGWETEVQIINHHGRYEHRWSVRVKYDDGDEKKPRTIRQYKHRGTDGPDAARQDNLEKAQAKAVEWMEDHPAERVDPSEMDQPVQDEFVADGGDENPWEGMDVLRSDEPETVRQVDLDKTEEATPDQYGVLTDDEGNGYGTDAWVIVDDGEQSVADDMAEDLEAAEATATEAVAEALRDRGVNNIVAHNLAEQYDTLEAVQSAAANTEDVTDIEGVGEASADEVREALDLNQGRDEDRDVEDLADDIADYLGKDRINSASRGALEDMAFEYISGHGEDPDDYGGLEAVTDALADRQSGTDTTSDGGESLMEADPQEAVSAAREADPDGDLPGPALRALKEAWSGYKHGIKEGREAAEAVEEYREEYRPQAEEYAAVINDIREAYGQEPIDFEGVEGIPDVPELGGEITEESTGRDLLSFDWSADPYDPTQEV